MYNSRWIAPWAVLDTTDKTTQPSWDSRGCLEETARLIKVWNKGVDLAACESQRESLKWLVTEHGGKLLAPHHPELAAGVRLTANTTVSFGFLRHAMALCLRTRGRPTSLRERLVEEACRSGLEMGVPAAMPAEGFLSEHVMPRIWRGATSTKRINNMRALAHTLHGEYSDLTFDATVDCCQSTLGICFCSFGVRLLYFED